VRTYSITRRIVLLVLLVEVIFASTTVALVYFYEKYTYFGALNISLRGHADSLLGAVVEASDDSDDVLLEGAGIQTPKNDLYEVWEKNKLLGRSGDLSGGSADLRNGPDGFLTLDRGGETYRVVRLNGLRIIDPSTLKVRHEVVVLYAAPTSGIWTAIRQAVRFFALANLLLLLLTAWLVFILVRRSVAPLDQLALESSQIAANSWRFVPSKEARSVRELEPLISALEGVISRLERSFSQQRTFVSDAAHELKTSVAVIKSSIQLLSMKERSGAEYHIGLERCQADCDRIEEMVQRMLLLATVEEGDRKTKALQSTRVMPVVTAVLAELEPIAQMKGVILRATDSDLLCATIAPERLKTICIELIQNAIQHSSAQGTVEVQVSKNADFVQLLVGNAGEEIEAAALPHLFERFYRSDSSRARATGGTGLGLAICKAIIEQAGGRISVRNKNGVEFLVELQSDTEC
jgi:signal transduction histidine kinase